VLAPDERETPRNPRKRRVHQERRGDTFFDQWLGARGEALRSLAQSIEANVAAYERESGTRHRGRRKDAGRKFSQATEVIVCNLAREVIGDGEPGHIAVQRGKRAFRSRYDNREVFNANTFSGLLDALQAVGVLHQEIGEIHKARSTIRPTENFAARVREAGITSSDFRQLPQELIVLRERHEWETQTGREINKQLVEYEDTPRVRTLRERMRRLNAAVEAANISYEREDGSPDVETWDRAQRRYFTRFPGLPDHFDLGGRLSAGSGRT
jgi:hypothetical protein